MRRALPILVPASLAALFIAALSGGARTASGQGSYIPRPPESDTILYPEQRHDPRIAPLDAHNPFALDPHVPKNEPKAWVNNDYFTIGSAQQATFLIPVVENAHLGPKTNPRGFWSRYNKGEWTLAAGELKYVLWVFPNHPRALFLLGMVARELKEPTIPIAYYEKAMRLFPTHAYTRAQYGAYLVELGEKLQGIMQLEEALKMDPNSLPARAWLDKAKRELGLDSAELGTPSSPGMAPVQADGIYVPRR